MASQLQCSYCFDCLIDAVSHSGSGSPSRVLPSAQLAQSNESYPLFVTWKKRKSSSDEWHLRGCIGTFAARELTRGLREYALISALRDTRFDPVTADEIAHLQCEVSLLIDFEHNLHAEDWTVGVHGITIEFEDPQTGRSYNAVYLPEVAAEQGWDVQQTLEELVYKSGYRRKFTEQLKQSISLTRFKSSKASLSYTEYKKLKLQSDDKQSASPVATQLNGKRRASPNGHLAQDIN